MVISLYMQRGIELCPDNILLYHSAPAGIDTQLTEVREVAEASRRCSFSSHSLYYQAVKLYVMETFMLMKSTQRLQLISSVESERTPEASVFYITM